MTLRKTATSGLCVSCTLYKNFNCCLKKNDSQMICHSLVLQEQLQKEGPDDWHLVTLGFTVRSKISCRQLCLLLLCEHCVDEHSNQIWLRG